MEQPLKVKRSHSCALHIYAKTSYHLYIKRLRQLGTEQQSGQDFYSNGYRMTLKDHRIKLALHCTSTPSHLPLPST